MPFTTACDSPTHPKRMKKNVILTHTVETHEWGFRRVLSENAGREFEIEYMSTGNGSNKLRNLACYFLFPLQVFLRRSRYDCIVANQQFYGLLLAFYCRLFHVSKTFRLVIITFIYLPKQGLIGQIYGRFMRYITSSNYIDQYIVRSSRELETYATQLGIDRQKLKLVPLGLGGNVDAADDPAMQSRRYVLSAGRSNRDYGFLVDALQGTTYNVDIICDTCTLTPKTDNITIHRDIHETFPLWMRNCYCVVIPLRDTQVSSGQLVLLQAMMEGKPVIVTDADAVRDYLIAGETAITIHNTREDLLNALDRLYTDHALYQRLSDNSRRIFAERYSADQAVAAIGRHIAELYA